MRANRPSVPGLVLTLALAATASANGINEWLGGSGLWSNGANWSLGHPPTSSEYAVLPSGSTYTVTLDGSASVRSYILGGGPSVQTQTLRVDGGSLVAAIPGTIQESGSLDLVAMGSASGEAFVFGRLYFDGGEYAGGPVHVTSNGRAIVDGAGGELSGAELIVEGLLEWWNGPLTLYDASLVHVAPGGIFRCDGATDLLAGQGGGQVWNESVVSTVLAGARPKFHVPLLNDGYVNVMLGELSLRASASTGGNWEVGPAGVLSLVSDSGTDVFAFDESSSVFGGGRLEVLSGRAVLAGGLDLGTLFLEGGDVDVPLPQGGLGPVGPPPANPTVQVLDLDEGVLRLLGTTLDVASQLLWSGGDVEGAGTLHVLPSTTSAISGNAARALRAGAHLVLDGQVTWSGNATITFDDARMDVGGPGQFDAIGQGVMSSAQPLLDRLLVLGVFGRSSMAPPGEATTVHVPITNFGTIGSLSGRLVVTGGGDGEGQWGSDVAGTLVVQGGPWSFDGPTGGSGPVGPGNPVGLSVLSLGTVHFDGAQAAIGGAYDVAWTIVDDATVSFNGPSDSRNGTTFDGGNFAGAGEYREHGFFDWVGGLMTGGGITRILPDASLQALLAGGAQLAAGRHLRIEGGASFHDEHSLSLQGGHVIVEPGGQLDLSGDVNVACDAGCVPGTEAFTNLGTLTHSSGGGTATVAPAFGNEGYVDQLASTLAFGQFVQRGLDSVLALTDATVRCLAPCVIDGGSVIGRGTFEGSLVNNGGIVAPGFSEGKLTITNNYTQAANGAIAVEVGGPPPSGKFDQVEVQGQASLAGSMNVMTTDNYQPTLGDKFSLVGASSVQGSFNEVTAPAGADGTQLAGKIEGAEVILVAGVALRVGDGFTAGVTGTLPVFLSAGPACVRTISGSVAVPATLAFDSFTSDSACTFTATPAQGNSLALALDCGVAGGTGVVQVGTLTFDVVNDNPPRHAITATGTATARDCAGQTATLDASVQGGQLLFAGLGDIFPSGSGDSSTDLRDFVEGRRKNLGISGTDDRDTVAGDLEPSLTPCMPTNAAASTCPKGNGVFDLADVVGIRRIVSGVRTIGCRACALAPSFEPSGIAGDLAPRHRPDSRVDVQDVVAALRLATGLDPSDEVLKLVGDVAPLVESESGESLAAGDGAINVADVVVLLRACTGQLELDWPRRELVLDAEAAAPWIAMTVRVGGWPAWARLVVVEAPACGAGDPGFDREGAQLGFACEADAPREAGALEAVRLAYRAPREVTEDDVRITGDAVNDALAFVPFELTRR